MNQQKRYQIFVSSTFADLEEERGKVMETILNFDCFPAGMEMFPAMDEEIFEYIKRIINDSDCYLLIIGGRYGSVADDGVSWTEKEYDYAVSKGKPVIAFDHKDFTQLPANKTDQDDKKRKKLIAFKRKIYEDKQIAWNKWSNPDELAAKVATTLPRVLERQPSEAGWVRADSIISEDSLEKIKKLQERIKELEASKENQDWERLSQEAQEKIQQPEGTVDERRTCPQMKDYSCFLTEEKIQNMITEAIRALVQSSLQKETKEPESVFVPSDDTQIKPTEIRNNRVYICYRHTGKKDEQDEKVASEIYDALESEGYDCWMISRDLKDVGSDKWAQCIPEAIHKCNLFIIVLSKKSFIIDDEFFDWVFRAVKTAVEDKKLIKPFWIEALEEDDQKDPLKHYLRKYTAIDASGDYLVKIPELLNYVVGKLGAP